jgi:hypothetical protein
MAFDRGLREFRGAVGGQIERALELPEVNARGRSNEQSVERRRGIAVFERRELRHADLSIAAGRREWIDDRAAADRAHG